MMSNEKDNVRLFYVMHYDYQKICTFLDTNLDDKGHRVAYSSMGNSYYSHPHSPILCTIKVLEPVYQTLYSEFKSQIDYGESVFNCRQVEDKLVEYVKSGLNESDTTLEEFMYWEWDSLSKGCHFDKDLYAFTNLDDRILFKEFLLKYHMIKLRLKVA